MIKKTLAESFCIAMAAVLLALAINWLRPEGLPLFFNGRTNAPNGPSETGFGAGEIALADAIENFKTGQALFVDARPDADYAAGHIPGALNLTMDGMDAWVDGFIAENDVDTLIIAYCDGVHCDLGHDLAEQLQLLGFARAYYLKNGWQRWKTSGMPVAPEN